MNLFASLLPPTVNWLIYDLDVEKYETSSWGNTKPTTMIIERNGSHNALGIGNKD